MLSNVNHIRISRKAANVYVDTPAEGSEGTPASPDLCFHLCAQRNALGMGLTRGLNVLPAVLSSGGGALKATKKVSPLRTFTAERMRQTAPVGKGVGHQVSPEFEIWDPRD